MTASTPPTSEDTNEIAKSPWVSHFYTILPNAGNNALLMLPSPQGWRLPYLRAESIWLSETGRIIPLLRESLGFDFAFTIQRYIAYNENTEERWSRLIFVLEPGQPVDQPPLDGRWVDRMALYHLHLAQPEQRNLLIQYLEANEQDAPHVDTRRAPWARPGWFAAATAWIQQALTESGYTSTGPIEQLRNWSLSSLLVAPSSAGKLYFKAAAALPLFVNEPALTQTLAELYPNHLPTLVKIERANRWMLMQEFGPSARDSQEIDHAAILATYGALQRDSANHLDKLFAAGCIDRRLPVLLSQIDALIADPITQEALTPPEYATLVTLAPQLKERCALVAAANLPATLLHGDLHFGNVTQRNGDYLFFDWTDAAIGFPFVDHFQLYFYDSEEIAARDAYLAQWQEFASAQQLLELWQLAKPLCALHHSVSYLSILNNIEPLVRAELFHGLPDNLHHLLASFA